MTNEVGYVVGSTEGRAHIQYYGASADKSFAFRSNRVPITGGAPGVNVFPLSSAAFHPVTGVLATTGGAEITLWNHLRKAGIRSFYVRPQSPITQQPTFFFHFFFFFKWLSMLC